RRATPAWRAGTRQQRHGAAGGGAYARERALLGRSVPSRIQLHRDRGDDAALRRGIGSGAVVCGPRRAGWFRGRPESAATTTAGPLPGLEAWPGTGDARRAAQAGRAAQLA